MKELVDGYRWDMEVVVILDKACSDGEQAEP